MKNEGDIFGEENKKKFRPGGGEKRIKLCEEYTLLLKILKKDAYFFSLKALHLTELIIFTSCFFSTFPKPVLAFSEPVLTCNDDSFDNLTSQGFTQNISFSLDSCWINFLLLRADADFNFGVG